MVFQLSEKHGLCVGIQVCCNLRFHLDDRYLPALLCQKISRFRSDQASSCHQDSVPGDGLAEKDIAGVQHAGAVQSLDGRGQVCAPGRNDQYIGMDFFYLFRGQLVAGHDVDSIFPALPDIVADHLGYRALGGWIGGRQKSASKVILTLGQVYPVASGCQDPGSHQASRSATCDKDVPGTLGLIGDVGLFRAVEGIDYAAYGLVGKKMHDAALPAADAGNDRVVVPGFYLLREMGVSYGLAPKGHHVGASVSNGSLRDLRIRIPSNRDDRDAHGALDPGCGLCLIAGSQIGGADTVSQASVSGDADMDGCRAFLLAHLTDSFCLLYFPSACDHLRAADPDNDREIVSRFFSDIPQHKAEKAYPVVEGASEFIRPFVGVPGQELSDEIAVGGVELHCVKAGLFASRRSVSEGLHHLVYLFCCHLPGHGLAGGTGNLRGSQDRNAAGVFFFCLPSAVPQLDRDLCPFSVNGAGQPFVAGDQRVIPESAFIDQGSSVVADRTAFQYQKPEAAPGPLGVVGDQFIARLAAVKGQVGSHGRHDKPVLYFHRTDFYRCK